MIIKKPVIGKAGNSRAGMKVEVDDTPKTSIEMNSNDEEDDQMKSNVPTEVLFKKEIMESDCYTTSEEMNSFEDSKKTKAVSRGLPKTITGRRRHTYYFQLDFTPTKASSGKVTATCNVCSKTIKNTSIDRLRVHRNVCSNGVKKNNNSINLNGTDENELWKSFSDSTNNIEFYKADSEDETSSLVVEVDPLSSFKNLADAPSTSSRKMPPIKIKEKPAKRHKNNLYKKSDPLINKNISQDKSKLDISLAKFFYGCNIPFDVVENSYFKNFVKSLCPSYYPPTKAALSSILLDKVKKEIQTSNKEYIGNSSTLSIDSWSDDSKKIKNVVTMLHSIGTENIFLKCQEFPALEVADEVLADICKKSISDAKSQYKCEIYAIVSDNAANIRKYLPDLWHIPCSSHVAHLLVKDIINTEVLDQVNCILKEFQSLDLLNLISDNEDSKLQLLAENRWRGHINACKSFLSNLPLMKQIASDGSIIPEHITLSLSTNDFLEDVQITFDLLKFIVEFINKFENEEFSIAEASEEWLNLETKIRYLRGYNIEMQTAIRKRVNMVVTVYGSAANLFHPAYRGRLLNKKQLKQVQDFVIESLDTEGLNAYSEFHENTGIFQNLMKKNITKPTTFWGLVDLKHPSLTALAVKLLKIPASSTGYFTSSCIDSSLRDGLAPEKCEKLKFVYHTLKRLDNIKSDQY